MLQDLLVIELAGVLAGPSVGMFLAELGARVIKVENPRTRGDVTRSWHLASEDSADDRPAYFCAVNWGKESLALDLTDPEDLALLQRMIGRADVLLGSFVPGQAPRLGLDPEELLHRHPRLIIGEVNGYGPDEARPAFDAIIQAEAGFTYLNGTPGAVHKMPVALMDVLAAHQLKEALLLAYIERLHTGRGRRVQVSLLQSGLASLANQATNWLVGGVLPQPKGSDHPNIVPYGTIFTTAAGGRVVLAVGNDRQFAALCAVLGEAVPTEWASNAARVQHREAVQRWLSQRLASWPQDALLEALHARGVPAGAVNDMQQALAQPLAQPLLLSSDGLGGLRSLVAEGLPKQTLSPPPHLNAQGKALREEFGGEWWA